ncbi:hypothetical protein GGR52DRAFT_50951 [Hypoxylon sp. FL1284]|nr:hypothetical protein GGR52DRAFT_50951 [Hypoxylon sp. FL1284]
MEAQGENSTDESTTHVEVDHRYNADGDNSVGPADIGLKNAGACIGACFDQFMDGWYRETGGGFEDVCKQLSGTEPDTELWKLYCCDSTYCGVWAPTKGKSPSVDLIINKCQNAGNYLIYDPGPPPADFSCKSVANATEPGATGVQTVSSSNSPSTTAAAPSATSTGAYPSSDLNSTVSDAGVAPSTSTGLAEGSKAAIGVCASLAIIAVIFLVGFLISRRRSRPESYFDEDALGGAPRHGRSFSEPPSGSRTPLISPPPSAVSSKGGGTLRTPPLRLSDRRFLPLLLKQGGTTSSSLTTAADERAVYKHAAFGLPPEKAALRHERRATTNSIGHPYPYSHSHSPLPHPTAVHFAPHFLRDSGSSYSSGPGGASTVTTTGSNKAVSVRSGAFGMSASPLLQPLSPARLATPAGPPPTRALPAPPPYHPASPTFTVSPISPSASPGLRPLALAENKERPESPVVVSPLPSSARDASNLAGSHVRETAESWGSWSGGSKKRGYGNNDRALDPISSGDQKGTRESMVSLQDLDLEKLGGKY